MTRQEPQSRQEPQAKQFLLNANKITKNVTLIASCSVTKIFWILNIC